MTVVCYEQRGCGRSDPPPSADDYSLPLLVSDLDELRAALEIDRVVLLGYSFGSELAMEYALPRRCSCEALPPSRRGP